MSHSKSLGTFARWGSSMGQAMNSDPKKVHGGMTMKKIAYGFTLAVLAVGMLALVSIRGQAQAQTPTTAPTTDNQTQSDGVSLTIYNEGTALVQDRRTFDLKAGTNALD